MIFQNVNQILFEFLSQAFYVCVLRTHFLYAGLN